MRAGLIHIIPLRLAAKLADSVLAPYRQTSMLGRCGLVIELFACGS